MSGSQDAQLNIKLVQGAPLSHWSQTSVDTSLPGAKLATKYEVRGVTSSSASKIRQHCHQAVARVGELGVDVGENAGYARVWADGA